MAPAREIPEASRTSESCRLHSSAEVPVSNPPRFPAASTSHQSPEGSWAPQRGSSNVFFSGRDNRDTKEMETKGLRSFVMQSQGFGALKPKAAAAPAHWSL